MRRGIALVIDYGYEADEYYAPERPEGTLRAYRRHQLENDPLADPGSADLTAHANFTALANAAEREGLRRLGLADRGDSSPAPAWGGSPRSTKPIPPSRAKMIRQFQTLAHPGIMGRSFRVLGLAKALRPAAGLVLRLTFSVHFTLLESLMPDSKPPFLLLPRWRP
ncbi:MAG: SAM-dependent methyltransferase [Verrucomicrobiales bacterium]